MAACFKIDENVPRAAVTLLGEAGYDVRTVIDQHLGGLPDAAVLDVCRSERRVLVTLDLDFADIRLYPVDSHAGVWVLRPATHSINNILVVLRGALDALGTETCENRLWIVEPSRVRIRQ